MKNLVLLQIVIYLFISPVMILMMGDVNEYKFSLSIFFLCSFLIGVIVARLISNKYREVQFKKYPYIPVYMKFVFMTLALMYIYVVIENGLLDRRQGSEVMALLYSGLPLAQLAVLRIFEVIFYPILFITLVGIEYDRGKIIKIMLFLFVVAFFFTGILDSRAKIISLPIYYYLLFYQSRSGWNPISRKAFFAGGILTAGVFLLIVTSRLNVYDSIYEYLQVDFFSRLDGLNFISRVSQDSGMRWWGTADLNVFANFISVIPFLESSAELKAAGMTSSKNYLLQEILGSSQFDISNSMITDLYYFGGYFFLCAGGGLYGYFVKRFDTHVKFGRIWQNRFSLAIAMSFLLNAFRFESDYFGVILSFIRDFIIIYLILLGVKFINRPAVID